MEFINGVMFKLPREGAPEFAKGSLSIKRLELLEYLNTKNEEWLNIDLLVSKKGKPYAKLNEYKKPEQGEACQDEQIGEVPF